MSLVPMRSISTHETLEQNCSTCSKQSSMPETRHWACGHLFKGSSINTPDIIAEGRWQHITGTKSAQPGWTISRPRWCQNCIRERVGRIVDTHKYTKGYRGHGQDQEVVQMAWSKGFRDGRIEAHDFDLQKGHELKIDDLLGDRTGLFSIFEAVAN